MKYKNLNKILIFAILSLLVNRVVNGQKFIPEPRVDHTATLLGNKIYYVGGIPRNAGSLSDFFYLNIDENLDLSWVDLKSQGVKFPQTDGHTSDIGGTNRDSIFIIGGEQLEKTNLVYRFDTKTKEITTPLIQGKEPPRRRDMRSVSYVGKIYIFSGITFDSVSGRNRFFDNFDILDTVSMTWSVGSLVNAPIPRFYYTATLVDGVIYYIGGIRQDQSSTLGQEYVPMANISQYDINANTWSIKMATGVIPGARAGHSAVLVNNKICIYGGVYNSTKQPANFQIATLDTTSLVWSIPTLSNPNIPTLVFHTATQYGTDMLLAFGDLIDVSVGGVVNNYVYIFHFRNLNVTWGKAKFAQPQPQPQPPLSPPTPPKQTTPPPPKSQTTSASPASTSTNTAAVGLSSVGVVAVGLIAGFVGFFICL